MEDEKHKIEAAKKCKNCGFVVAEGLKSHNFQIGTICNACYQKMTGEDFKRWNKAAE